jgi:hypothetical protein
VNYFPTAVDGTASLAPLINQLSINEISRFTQGEQTFFDLLKQLCYLLLVVMTRAS